MKGELRCLVVSVKQSPMNQKRWLLTLACQHEVWVTALRRPRLVTAACLRCMVLHREGAGR